MKNVLAVAAIVLAGFPAHSRAQDAKAALDAAITAMGTASLQSIEYSGAGTNNTVGQSAVPGGPWPRFTVTKYVARVNYDLPAMRVEVVRVDDQSPPRGGGAGPFSATTGQGGIRPIPGEIIQNQAIDGRAETGALTIWLTPHGFLKGALANASTLTTARAGGRTTLSFTAFGKHTVTATLGAGNLVERVETLIDNNYTGDTRVEALYSNYKDVNGVKFPSRIVQHQGGHPVLDLAVESVQPNSAAALDVRAAPGRGGGPPAGAPSSGGGISAEKIADGVWFLSLGAPQSLLVEFRDHVVIIEAPANDERSLATIAEARRMFPAKPIRYVVSTHHHADHSGGIRAYAAEGIAIIAHDAQKAYYEQQILKNPHTLNPDRLARAPRAAVVEGVNDKRVLTDGTMTLELHLIRGNLHSEGLLMAYLPRERMLIQADAFHPRPGAAPLKAPSPYTVNLLENIRRLKLDVAQIVHVHGGMDPLAALVKAAGQ